MVTLKFNFMKTLLMVVLMNIFCSKDKTWKDDELSIKRTDYIGSQLRIDGFYYNKWGSPERATIFFLYRNGVLLEGGSPLMNDFAKREQEFLNGSYYNNVKTDKLSWGSFLLEGNTIKIEKWYASDPPLKAYVKEGNIVNDTTFVVTKRYRVNNGKRAEEAAISETYHFKEFSPKPDSTNSFIK